MTYDVTIDRDKYIGGSDIACIMGISPFKTRYQLLLEKACLATNDFNGNEYTEYGNVMEDKIRTYVNEKLGTNFIPERKIEGSIRYHADGVDFDKEMVIIYCYTTIYVREQKLENVSFENNILTIEFDVVDGKPGTGDATAPQTRTCVICLDKVVTTEVKITYNGQ